MAKKRIKTIKLGLVGANGQGESFVAHAEQVGMKCVAICDLRKEQLKELKKRYQVETYTDYDKFLEHDLDAVVVATPFHTHAPLAIKALRAGKHVMSETSACLTMAQGVELIREVEKSRKIYMFAENCAYYPVPQEMRRLYKAGEIGDFKYGEGAYLHPMSAEYFNSISFGVNHWRNWLPVTYYNTHSLAPIMYITDTWPVKVNGFVIPHDPYDRQKTMTARRCDTASAIILRMNNEAVVRLLQYDLRGKEGEKILGNRGMMERFCFGSGQMIRVHKKAFDKKPSEPDEKVYTVDFPPIEKIDVGNYSKSSAAATSLRLKFKSGAVTSLIMDYLFAEAIRRNEQPYMNVYRAVAMSAVGILAYRSALADSVSLEIPDFRKEAIRQQYEQDHWSPDPAVHTDDQPWPSILGDIKPSKRALAYAQKMWKKTEGTH